MRCMKTRARPQLFSVIPVEIMKKRSGDLGRVVNHKTVPSKRMAINYFACPQVPRQNGLVSSILGRYLMLDLRKEREKSSRGGLALEQTTQRGFGISSSQEALRAG